MKLTTEQEAKLTELAFEERPNKEIAEELGIELTDVHAARSRLGITIPKVKEAKEKGFHPPVPKRAARAKNEIQQEIAKVERAKAEAARKFERCVRRLVELKTEMKGVK